MNNDFQKKKEQKEKEEEGKESKGGEWAGNLFLRRSRSSSSFCAMSSSGTGAPDAVKNVGIASIASTKTFASHGLHHWMTMFLTYSS